LIFGVAGTLLLLDTARNNRREEARRAAIEVKFSELYDRIQKLEAHHQLRAASNQSLDICV
jgi:hypothetical protein